jgi:hypothetical protein
VRIAEKALEFDVDAAVAAIELGKTRLALGDPTRAREVLERAVTLLDGRRSDAPPETLGAAKLALAQAVARQHKGAPRARALAREAKGHLAETRYADPGLRRALGRFLDRVR